MSVEHDRTGCQDCWLRSNPRFRPFEPAELDFVSSFKKGQMTVEAGGTILLEGTASAHLFTVKEGWGYRYKILEDGRRQVLNYIVPGDLVGLQGTLTGEMQHSVEALTPMELCIFERDRIGELFQNHSGLAFDITWIAAQEERILDEHLLSIGRRTALERAAYLLLFLDSRGRESGLLKGKTKLVPVTQQLVADTLGLSIVHTNKTLRKLVHAEYVLWRDGGFEVLDMDALSAISSFEPDPTRKRPFI